MKKILNVLILVFITAVSCTTKYNNMHSFETVWQTINDKHFDPSFGGLDWNDVYNRYQPKIAAVEKNEEFYFLINKMLFELNLSHMFVLAPEDLSQLVPILAAEGSIGIDVRMLDNDAVITSVKSDSPGFQAGLRSGYIIKSIDGIDIEKITDLKQIDDIKVQDIEEKRSIFPKILGPPYNERNRKKNITGAILEKIYGPPNTLVSIEYVDEKGDSFLKKIVRAQRKGKMKFYDEFPPFFVEFESKLLENNIGYVRFNAFMPPVHDKFKDTIESMQDTSALIIDIRGNHGGFFHVRKEMAETLVKDRILFWRYQERDKTQEVYLEPVDNGYDRAVVVIVDHLSVSSAEEFSGGLKAIKRATIVGERTPGVVVTGNFEKLPNGATFVYPKAWTITADGTVLEGHGVIPDIEITLDRSELLRGNDSQLEAAVKSIGN
ncbi:MAG: PDZ domain-containing protein [Desulfobacterales bacterium]|nr:PDZ domain-containing protein [Desulfobacterales bacterium]